MPARHFRHICSASFYLFGTSTLQGTARLPGCRTGQVPAWTGLRKDPTRVAKGEFQVHYWPKPGEKKHMCCTCSASAGNRASLRFCAVAKWDGINHFLTNPNSYLRVPSQSLFCHAISKVSQTLRFLSKYSSSQMAGTLLWQGKTRLKITWWCIIMLDGTRLSGFTQRDLCSCPT